MLRHVRGTPNSCQRDLPRPAHPGQDRRLGRDSPCFRGCYGQRAAGLVDRARGGRGRSLAAPLTLAPRPSCARSDLAVLALRPCRAGPLAAGTAACLSVVAAGAAGGWAPRSAASRPRPAAFAPVALGPPCRWCRPPGSFTPLLPHPRPSPPRCPRPVKQRSRLPCHPLRAGL